MVKLQTPPDQIKIITGEPVYFPPFLLSLTDHKMMLYTQKGRVITIFPASIFVMHCSFKSVVVGNKNDKDRTGTHVYILLTS